jgi:hypothetical protein
MIHHHTGGLENDRINWRSQPTIHHHTGGLENNGKSEFVNGFDNRSDLTVCF